MQKKTLLTKLRRKRKHKKKRKPLTAALQIQSTLLRNFRAI